ncbi:MAG: Biopolymer transport protein ExbD/TolR [Gemmataceae bacterium]|nr:Biopolymer transport protein ExbD/TolR [Gemmataceae bacterium]
MSNITVRIGLPLMVTGLLTGAVLLKVLARMSERDATGKPGRVVLTLPWPVRKTSEVAGANGEKPVTFVVRVESTVRGTIRTMSLTQIDEAGAPTIDLGADLRKYETDLTKRFDALRGKPGRLTLEIGDGLQQEFVVALVDVGIRVGFQDVTAVPLDPKKR